jgi:hypothetical protein
VTHASGITEGHTPQTDAEALLRDVDAMTPLERARAARTATPPRS